MARSRHGRHGKVNKWMKHRLETACAFKFDKLANLWYNYIRKVLKGDNYARV